MAEGHAIAEEYRLQSFESLGTAVVPFDVFGMNLSHGIYADGVLGWDFLANLKMTIDFVYGTIRILKPTKPRTRRK